jgi:hypothetical protein
MGGICVLSVNAGELMVRVMIGLLYGLWDAGMPVSLSHHAGWLAVK